MSWKLIALSEPIAGQILNIERDMVIGRHQQADIVLQAAHVSRRHAALLLKDDQLWIQDLGSSNGTFVNGQQITEQQLNHDDQISFETIVFRIAQETDAPAQEQAPSDLNKTVPSDEGMRTLSERAVDVNVTPEGMPTNVGIPKPAPIPDHIDINNVQVEPEPAQATVLENRVEQAKEEQKNAKVGLISFFVLIILIIIAVIAFGS